MRRVLEVIPQSVFRILSDVIDLQTHRLRGLPIKMATAKIRDYAQLDHRYLLARATHQISVFTEGILAMESTLLGVIQVDPRQILEDGIRKELVRQITGSSRIVIASRSLSAMWQKDLRSTWTYLTEPDVHDGRERATWGRSQVYSSVRRHSSFSNLQFSLYNLAVPVLAFPVFLKVL